MNRRKFIKSIGIGLFGAMGVGQVVNLLPESEGKPLSMKMMLDYITPYGRFMQVETIRMGKKDEEFLELRRWIDNEVVHAFDNILTKGDNNANTT